MYDDQFNQLSEHDRRILSECLNRRWEDMDTSEPISDEAQQLLHRYTVYAYHQDEMRYENYD